MVGQTLRSISARANEKGLEMVFNVEQNVPDSLIGDPGRLRQILINLAGNAVKFSNRGDISILVTLAEESSEDVLLKFDIIDNGIGIAPEHQGRIFQAFEQGDSSTTKHFGGTGLGLAISKRLVNLMGGEITVTSSPGKGSCFSFTALLDKQENPPGITTLVETLEGISALVVDDNSINRQMLEGFLSRWKMVVYLATDADEALTTLEKMREAGSLPRLILTDVHMPDMDGWELIWQLRQIEAYNSIQAVIMPSAGVRGDASRCKELRIEGYLTKPVVMEELYDTLIAVVSTLKIDDPALVTRYSVKERLSGCSVLVVDDVEINREVLSIALQKQGHQVTITKNGLEAVDKFRSCRFDIIYMDMQMPVLNGYDAVRQIRTIEKERSSARTPIVAMTAYAMQGDREKCLAADMDAYLSKPARPSEILDILNKLVLGRAVIISPTDTSAGNEPCKESPQETSESDEGVPVFARNELLERLGGREELLGRFTDMFTGNVAGYMESLVSAIESGDRDQVRIQAHTIKGAAANIAARRVRETATAMEAHAREGRFAEASGLLQRLKDEIDEFNSETSVK